MPTRVDFKTQRDFTGGLFLNRNGVQLDDNATSDCLNVDLDRRGGFYLRRGVAPYYNAAAAAAIHSILPFYQSNGTNAVLIGAGTAAYKWTGSAWASIFTGLTGPYRSVTFKDRLYVVSAGNQTQRWNGTTNTAITDPAVTPSWNDNLSAPTSPASTGKFPKAAVACAYQNVMFVGNITENATAYPNRVRWSHPGYPEDWVSYHYIDIEPDDGDQITGLVPLQDRLIVFKHNSIHAIYGTPPEDFSVVPIARDVGATSQEAIASTDQGIYLWDESTGLHLLQSDPQKGTRTTWVFEPLWPAIEDGSISAGNMRYAHVGVMNRRIWVSVPWQSGSTRDRTFVYDPFLGKRGAWTAYDLGVGPFLNYSPPNSGATPLAASTSSNYLLEVEKFGRVYDDFGAGATHITSYYMTRWHDGGEAIVRKRWKRPEFVVLNEQNSTITVLAYRDFDPTASYKSFTLGTVTDTSQDVWDTAVWDTAVWGREGGDTGLLVRGSPLGNARAVALKFEGPSTNTDWRVDALTMKWVSKRVRN